MAEKIFRNGGEYAKTMKHFVNAEKGTVHGYLSSNLVPILSIRDGDSVVFKTLEADWRIDDRLISSSKEGHFLPERKPEDIGHALCGPIYIEGASAGQTLEVSIKKLKCGTWGWSRFGGGDPDHLQQMGFNGDEYFLYWKLKPDQGIGISSKGHTIKIKPFLGICTVAPQTNERVSTHQPGAIGGNLDCKELCEGAKLYLPIFTEGALFSVGDGHAAQGDGELGGTAIECPMEEAELGFKIINSKLDNPICKTNLGWITFGFDRDLTAAAYQAIKEMIKLMQALYGYNYKEAVAIASVTVDLRVTQIVNGIRGVHAVLNEHSILSDC